VHLIQTTPQNLDYRFNLGVVQTQLEDYSASMNTLLEILELQPNYIRAYVVLGQVYEVQDRFEDAKRIYEVALKRWPNEAVFRDALNVLVSE
jgi:tetratricopeptide (TPR) repeat protein